MHRLKFGVKLHLFFLQRTLSYMPYVTLNANMLSHLVGLKALALGTGLSFFLSFFIFCNTPSRGLRTGVITSYCHSTKCKKKKKVDDSG